MRRPDPKKTENTVAYVAGCSGAAPFAAIILAVLLLVIFFPWLSLALL